MKIKLRAALIFFAILASMPAFYIRARAEQPTVKLSAENLIVQFKSAPDFLKNDSKITAIKEIFPDNNSPSLQNVYRISSSYSQSEFKDKYYSSINYAEVQNKLSLASTNLNDPGFTLNSADTNHLWALQKSSFTEAWDKSSGSTKIKVAVIDTGIDGTHEDLAAGQIVEGFNFLTSTHIAPSTNSDDNGHGTLVAGVIAATANNFRGIAGAALNASLMPLKTLDDKGSGNSEDIASAIVWAADHGANIINMSLGGNGFSNDSTLSNAVAYAFNKNVLLVAAAGNDVASTGGNMDTNPVYPICNDNGQNMILGVAATDFNDQKAPFSNYGQSCVDVSAPGKRILSTINFDPVTNKSAQNSYAFASGTSLAAPFVSAEAVLIKAYYPDATNKEIRNRIIKSTDPIDIFNTTQCGGLDCKNLIGSGRINAFKALDSALVSSAKLGDGDLAYDQASRKTYYISGGQKHLVSDFVLAQRFSSVQKVNVSSADLSGFPEGPAATPLENTVVKMVFDNTVYQIIGGQKRPFNFAVFKQRNIQNSEIMFVSSDDLNSWVTGKFVPPVEGTLVKTSADQTVYWVVDGVLHPINYQFWIDRGLNIFPIMQISQSDLKNFAQGNAFIR